MAEADPPPPAADWLALLAQGDEAAAEAVFERYAERLTRLAQSRLSARLAARVDAEDIVQSAWRSFFVAVRAGRFQLAGGGDLWRLLVEVTLHKLYRQAARQRAQRRNIHRDTPLAQLDAAGGEPTPEEAALAADELEALLRQLPERSQQAVELRLQGYEQAEIAEQLGCHERTVRRSLAEARRLLTARGGGDFIPTAARRRRQAPQSPVELPAALIAAARLPWSDFVLREQIGAGASGKVYRAWHKSAGREVAIKFLRKSLLVQPPAIERFLREAQTVAQLAHPGIVAVHGAGRTTGGGFFLLMDLIRGRNLDEVRRAAAVAPEQAAAWVAAAARIVHFAHEQGVIHCDLKPSNLLVDEQGRIYVTDFGLAIPLAGGGDESTHLAGTPACMAPEQADPRWGPLSPQTDVYGLGAVLFCLLFGRPPHVGQSVAEVLSLVVGDSPVALPVGANIAAGLAAIVHRCLAKPPSERYSSAALLADDLESRAAGG